MRTRARRKKRLISNNKKTHRQTDRQHSTQVHDPAEGPTDWRIGESLCVRGEGFLHKAVIAGRLRRQRKGSGRWQGKRSRIGHDGRIREECCISGSLVWNRRSVSVLLCLAFFSSISVFFLCFFLLADTDSLTSHISQLNSLKLSGNILPYREGLEAPQ